MKYSQISMKKYFSY